MTAPLLEVEGLVVRYAARAAPSVDGVSLRLPQGGTLGLVGESGCGKSTVVKAVLGLVPVAEGTIRFEGRDVTRTPPRRRMKDGVHIQVVFQDPRSSLNPRMTVRELVDEPLRIAGRPTAGVAEALVDRVGLPQASLDRRAHEFSGGQRQRIAIARALAPQPRLLVLDEPTSALDLSVQAQILNLLLELQRERGMAYLFVSHDLAVVRHLADDVAVMRGGRLVECGPAGEVLGAPRHAYTRELLASSQGVAMSGGAPAAVTE